MTPATHPNPGYRLPASTVRLARALVHDAKRRGTRETERIEQIAKMRLPDDSAD
jgi:hypothetical protein